MTRLAIEEAKTIIPLVSSSTSYEKAFVHGYEIDIV
jgi:hypothetical protein